MDVPFTGDAETDESTNISRGIATQGLPVVNMPDPTRTKNANQPYQKSGLHPITPRPSAENSVVLPHHRPARDGSIKPGKTGDSVAAVASTLSPRRESPGDRRNSEPSKWFDHSNQHATTTLDARAMDGKSASYFRANTCVSGSNCVPIQLSRPSSRKKPTHQTRNARKDNLALVSTHRRALRRPCDQR